MKIFKTVALLITLISLIGCVNNTISIGAYHDLDIDEFDNLTIASMSHQHSNDELHEDDTMMIYDLILKMEPIESNSASNNQKVLTTLNYIIVVNLKDSFFHIESGDDYISISFDGDNDESLITTVHIIDEEEMAEFNAIIEELFHH